MLDSRIKYVLNVARFLVVGNERKLATGGSFRCPDLGTASELAQQLAVAWSKGPTRISDKERVRRIIEMGTLAEDFRMYIVRTNNPAEVEREWSEWLDEITERKHDHDKADVRPILLN